MHRVPAPATAFARRTRSSGATSSGATLSWAALGLALLAATSGCSRAADDAGVATSGAAKSGAAGPNASGEGAQVFAMACVRCHGAQGAGDGPLAARLGYVPDLRQPLERAHVIEMVTRGRGAMPGHADRLSPAQIEAVADHVGRLRAR